LLKLLTLTRPAYGKAEQAVADEIVRQCNGVRFNDPSGKPLAVVVTVGDSKTLFSSHLDSVHYEDGIQEVIHDSNLNLIYKAQDSKTCLGSDDGSGVWLLLQMIASEVPGAYVFHFSEERGGIGSKGVVDFYSGFLAQFDRAIAFDRRGTRSIITHQSCGKCCSDEFGLALASKLDMGHKLDETGVYTDTAEFTSIISECTNVSVGYESEHTPNEVQDVEYLLALRKACIKVDWEALPAVRDPKEVEDLWDAYGYGRNLYTRAHKEVLFTIVEYHDKFKLYDEAEAYITSHYNMDYLEGYASCMAEMEGYEPVITYETDVERKLRLHGYSTDELEMDNPFNSWVNEGLDL
jgi:hypothetical protein